MYMYILYNIFSFIRKILGHILTFFLGKGVYIHYLMSIPTCKKISWLKISTIMKVIIFIISVCWSPPPSTNYILFLPVIIFNPLTLKINYTMEMVVFRSKGDLKGRGLIFRFMMYLRWISSAIIVWEMKNFNWFQNDFGFCNSSEYVQLLSLSHREIIFSNSPKIKSPI